MIMKSSTMSSESKPRSPRKRRARIDTALLDAHRRGDGQPELIQRQGHRSPLNRRTASRLRQEIAHEARPEVTARGLAAGGDGHRRVIVAHEHALVPPRTRQTVGTYPRSVRSGSECWLPMLFHCWLSEEPARRASPGRRSSTRSGTPETPDLCRDLRTSRCSPSPPPPCRSLDEQRAAPPPPPPCRSLEQQRAAPQPSPARLALPPQSSTTPQPQPRQTLDASSTAPPALSATEVRHL